MDLSLEKENSSFLHYTSTTTHEIESGTIETNLTNYLPSPLSNQLYLASAGPPQQTSDNNSNGNGLSTSTVLNATPQNTRDMHTTIATPPDTTNQATEQIAPTNNDNGQPSKPVDVIKSSEENAIAINDSSFLISTFQATLYKADSSLETTRRTNSSSTSPETIGDNNEKDILLYYECFLSGLY